MRSVLRGPFDDAPIDLKGPYDEYLGKPCTQPVCTDRWIVRLASKEALSGVSQETTQNFSRRNWGSKAS